MIHFGVKLHPHYKNLFFGATIDASKIGSKFFGVPKSKIKTDPLGVDTNAFSPTQNVEKIEKLRRSYGFASG